MAPSAVGGAWACVKNWALQPEAWRAGLVKVVDYVAPLPSFRRYVSCSQLMVHLGRWGSDDRVHAVGKQLILDSDSNLQYVHLFLVGELIDNATPRCAADPLGQERHP